MTHFRADVHLIQSLFSNLPISFASSCHESKMGSAPSMGISASVHICSRPSGPMTSGVSASAYVVNSPSAFAGEYGSALTVDCFFGSGRVTTCPRPRLGSRLRYGGEAITHCWDRLAWTGLFVDLARIFGQTRAEKGEYDAHGMGMHRRAAWEGRRRWGSAEGNLHGLLLESGNG